VKRQLPDFKTAEEEATFWEKHSVTPYINQMETVEFEVIRPKRTQINIRLDPGLLAQVQKIAAAKGIPYQTLIQLWVAEKAAGQDQRV
jgi:predicted DNA binding CopG/RHH family protein